MMLYEDECSLALRTQVVDKSVPTKTVIVEATVGSLSGDVFYSYRLHLGCVGHQW